jgi:hypothetical protein
MPLPVTLFPEPSDPSNRHEKQHNCYDASDAAGNDPEKWKLDETRAFAWLVVNDDNRFP